MSMSKGWKSWETLPLFSVTSTSAGDTMSTQERHLAEVEPKFHLLVNKRRYLWEMEDAVLSLNANKGHGQS